MHTVLPQIFAFTDRGAAMCKRSCWPNTEHSNHNTCTYPWNLNFNRKILDEMIFLWPQIHLLKAMDLLLFHILQFWYVMICPDDILVLWTVKWIAIILCMQLWYITTEFPWCQSHYNDVIMSTMASQITSLTIVYWSFYSGADQRKYQISASLAFVRGTHRWPVNSPHKGPVTWKMFPFDEVIMK